MLRQVGPLLLALIAVAVMPATAMADAYVSRPDHRLIVTGTEGDDALSLTTDESDFFVEGPGVSAGMNCTQLSATFVKCAKSLVTLVTLSMAGGNDDWSGGTGYPTQADGGAGNDTIYGGGGNDTLYGGGGSDVIYPGGGSDDVFGGDGTDTANYSNLIDYVDLPAAVRVSLDDQPNDGVDGASSNVRADIEDVVGSIGPDEIVGSSAPNRLAGGTGDDTIDARDGGADTVECGGGTDSASVDKADAVSGCETLQARDADGDGSSELNDCDDGNSARTPGAVEVAGNGTDEDCDGVDAPAAASPQPGTANPQAADPSPVGTGTPALVQVTATLRSAFRAGARTRVRRLIARGFQNPGSVQLRCSSRRRGCPFTRKTLKPARSGDVVLTRLFRRARLRPKAVLEVRVLGAGKVARVFRFTMRRNRAPRLQRLCLPPGASAPRACA